MIMDYSKYTATDLITTASFRAWVHRSDDDACVFWDNLLLQQPQLQPVAAEAKGLLLQLENIQQAEGDEEMDTVKANIDLLLDSRYRVMRRSGRVRMLRMGAVAASVLLIAGMVLLYYRADVKEEAGYADTKEVMLPDGSKITLNAHSSVSYKRHWLSWKEREVWLDGEAFFKVTSKPQGYHPKFIVHAGKLDVAVVGTAFNVYSRHNQVNVVLQEGKVIASATGDAQQAGTCAMHPGQLLHLQQGAMQLTNVNAADYINWMSRRLVFTNAPLRQVAQVLEDNYGYTIQWKKTSMKDSSFTGSCPSDNIRLLTAAISAVYNTNVTIKDNTIVFE